ncbi:MAG: Hydroxymethylpyrimidine/phosphomethylpyrimidine kinase [Candidatus Erwinia impunctatus]|nr:Hydroxymethylpyrimidine/phosphomethylpyrimidine kinase [Culicoides impunctatus]
MNGIPNVLTIAGFDGSAGAGLQADMKTISVFGGYAHTVLTALPIQNTCGVRQVYDVALTAIEQQLAAVFDDARIDAIKVGMLFNRDVIEVVAGFLRQHAQGIPLVLDPVMVSTSGHALLDSAAVDSLIHEMFPLATLVTPNIPEAEALSGAVITSPEEMLQAGQQLYQQHQTAILLKGGHFPGEMMEDILCLADHSVWLRAKKVATQNAHGTGCTLSSAIAVNLASGKNLEQACRIGKAYLSQALRHADKLQVGKGRGPVHHFFALSPYGKTEDE